MQVAAAVTPGPGASALPLRIAAMALIVVMGVLSCAAGEYVPDGPDVPPLVSALQAGIEQWLQETEFVCGYERIQARAAGSEQGLSGEYETVLESERVRGVFNKGFGMVRSSGDFIALPTFSGETVEGQEVMYLDYDEVSNERLLLRYNPIVNPSAPRGAAMISERASALDDGHSLPRFSAGWSAWREVNPLAIDGGDPGAYLAVRDDARQVVLSADQPDPARAVVELGFELYGYRYTKSVEFDMTSIPPVVDRVTLIQTSPAGEATECYSQASDFVTCTGGNVPKTVRHVFRNRHPEYPEAPWLVIGWSSPDLGIRQPVEEDFLVPIVEGTTVSGLQSAESAFVDGKLSLAAVTLDKLRPRGDRQNSALLAAEQPGSTTWKGLVLTNVVILVGVMVMRFRRRAGSPEGEG